MHTMRWSDLEYVLAVAGNGSAAAAARALNVNHTTVLRRVKAVEGRLNIRIFERLKSGYRLTPEGEMFLDAARSIEATMADLGRKMAGGDTALRGPLSVTTTDSIFPKLAADIAAFQRRYPDVIVDYTIANRPLDLDNRDADIAIRASVNPPAHLVGRRICDLRFGVFASRQPVKEDAAVPLERRRWLGLDAPLTGSVAGEWMRRTIPEENIVMRSNSFVGLRDLAAQDVGHAIMPWFLGRDSPELVHVPSPADEVTAGLWLLSHADVLRSRKVRLGTDFLYAALKARRAEFEAT